MGMCVKIHCKTSKIFISFIILFTYKKVNRGIIASKRVFRFSAPISFRSFKPCRRFLLAKQVRSPLWLKICPTRHIFLTRRAPKAAEAILTIFPINSKITGLSPKTAKRIVQHILLRGRDAVCPHIFYFPLSFRFAVPLVSAFPRGKDPKVAAHFRLRQAYRRKPRRLF